MGTRFGLQKHHLKPKTPFIYLCVFWDFTSLTSHQELLGPSSKIIQMMKKIAPIILKYINFEEKKVTRCQV